jgi:hypothetical protein
MPAYPMTISRCSDAATAPMIRLSQTIKQRNAAD